MNLIKLPVDLESLTSASIGVVFLGILLLSFLYLLVLFITNNKRVEQQLNLVRLIGGVSILLFALATGSAYIQFASLFIGGLLIASENFLVHLAAIFKSDGEKVPEVMQSYRLLSPDEIATKQKSEITESTELKISDSTITISSGPENSTESEGTDDNDNDAGDLATKDTTKEVPKANDKPSKNHSGALRKLLKVSMERYSMVTDMALSIVEGRIIGHTEMLRKLISLQANGITFRLDGIIIERNTNRIVSALEVKYFKKLDVNLIQSILTKQARWFDGVSYNLVFILVVEEYDYEKINELLKFRDELKQKSHNIGLVIYQLQTSSIGEKLDVLNDEDKLMMSENFIMHF